MYKSNKSKKRLNNRGYMQQNNNKQTFSFEIFPPKLTSDFGVVTKAIESMSQLNPDYISVTYGAGGSIQDNRTVELCKIIKKVSNVPPVAHITCVGARRQDLVDILNNLQSNGVNKILALRGDKNSNVQCEGDFIYASQMIEFIRENFGDYFDISAACYPTGHCESVNQKEDIFNLKKKVDSGAKHLITQLFFDNNEFYHFRELCDMADINVPIHAGIMPLTNQRQIQRMIALSGATLPSRLSKLIAKYGDNDKAMFDVGIAFAVEQICELLSNGVAGVHLYTMNNALVAQRITQSIQGLLSC